MLPWSLLLGFVPPKAKLQLEVRGLRRNVCGAAAGQGCPPAANRGCTQSVPGVTHTLSQGNSHPAAACASLPAPPRPFPLPGTPAAVPTVQAVATSPASSATCTSYSRQCGGTRPPGGLQATRSSPAADTESSSCSGAEGFAGRRKETEKVKRCTRTAPGGKASDNPRQPLPLFPADGISECSWLSATMLKEQDITVSGGWVIYSL